MSGLHPWPPLDQRSLHLAEAGSTNSEAMRLAGEGVPSGTWVIADRQTAGRGRSGRAWQSPAGNLHASLVLRDVFPLEKAAQLALVSGVAVHAAVNAAAGAALDGQLALKWPNDILLGRSKLGGILVESSVMRRDQGALAVIGVGLNLAHHPDLEDRPATDLSAHGASIAPLNFLPLLDRSMQEWISNWASGEGFAAVRHAWLARSLPLGAGLMVHSGQGIVKGVFAGLDPDGALLLTLPSGTLQTVTFGDVALSG
ncbi:MAG: biotin--[acetyl-CoA-carboxylase] ligase [Hyphomicrobium sp. 32-62-53]|jgi:BirA family transcriptional regulator, biotin operon repressor / biotin---[acetyl-CoA-carboxylase] ligase|nr:MAG: biotin--[acetyl-CoA-carboxylase] ligase [Hyphomicrobium sp. 12-62-95]OYX99560.1 MAG: biotin--[acetyl-CoA-carboxylase] ligase [Hyphomicrobium sp. 32-62-53]